MREFLSLILDRNSFEFGVFIVKRVFKAEFVRPNNEAVNSIRNTLSEREIAIYIHIPFCTGTCIFCPYARVPISRDDLDNMVRKYVDALMKEITMYSKITKDLNPKVVDVHAAVGCGAMGFIGGYEYENTCSVNEYIKAVPNDKLPIAGARSVPYIIEGAIRYTVCGLFVCRELDKSDFKVKFKVDLKEIIGKTGFAKAISLLKLTGDIIENGREISLTRKGLFTAHKICWAFVLNVPRIMIEEYTKKV